MPLFVHRKREEICRYQTPEEKLERYRNWLFPTAQELRTPYDVVLRVQNLGDDELLVLPDEYTFFADMTPRQFMRYSPPIQLQKREADFVKEVKRTLNTSRPRDLPRGISWIMGDGILAVYPLVCAIDGLVLYEAFEGSMASELFQFQGWSRERIRVSPNYHENSIVVRVPSRSLVEVKVHTATMHNPPVQNSQFECWDTFIKHQCGDTAYNRELNVGPEAIEEHDVAAFVAASKASAQIGNPWKSNFVLPFTREPADYYRKLVNQVILMDSTLKGKPRKGEPRRGIARNPREGEREGLFQAYVRTRQQTHRRRVGDRLFFDSLEEFEQELRKDNYILEILYPS